MVINVGDGKKALGQSGGQSGRLEAGSGLKERGRKREFGKRCGRGPCLDFCKKTKRERF